MPSTQFEVAELSGEKNSLNHTTSSRAGTLQEECLVASQYIAETPSAYGFPLLIKGLLESGIKRAPEQEIVSANQNRFTYREFAERVGRLASGLDSLGVERGDTVAIMDWDTHRYLECFFAVPMMGAALPHDGKTPGELVARAPWLTQGYFKDPKGSEKLWAGGWLHTGDVATIDTDGYVKITDRLKDMIRSGCEWISSLQLEDLILRHPGVAEAAVIGVPDPKCIERPLGLLVANPASRSAKSKSGPIFRALSKRALLPATASRIGLSS